MTKKTKLTDVTRLDCDPCSRNVISNMMATRITLQDLIQVISLLKNEVDMIHAQMEHLNDKLDRKIIRVITD